MFRNNKDKDVDVTSLNHILKTGKKLINIGQYIPYKKPLINVLL